MNKICIYGAGAVGGFIGALLAQNGCELSAIARGATLDALKRNGLRLESEGRIYTAAVNATDNPRELGPQDLVIVAVKAQAMSEVAAHIAPLIGPQTIVLTAMNGIPWWYFAGFGGEYSDLQLESVDPGGNIAAAIPGQHVIGCVVHGSFSLNEPGFARHGFGQKLILGEPDGSRSERLHRLATLLEKAGIKIETTDSIQREIWYKLWGNMTMNPVSALTGATCDRVLDDELVRTFCNRIMLEASAIGARIGCPIEQSPEQRNLVTRKLGAFKTSMLQDVEAGRPLEIDALVSAVREIGQKVGVKTPDIDTLLGLTRLFARVRGLYPEEVKEEQTGD